MMDLDDSYSFNTNAIPAYIGANPPYLKETAYLALKSLLFQYFYGFPHILMKILSK